jgi:hypothetical protein
MFHWLYQYFEYIKIYSFLPFIFGCTLLINF